MKSEGNGARRRKVAAHRLITSEGELPMAVVEIACGVVTAYRHLDGEEPFTEWVGGEIVLECDIHGRLRAFHGGRLLE